MVCISLQFDPKTEDYAIHAHKDAVRPFVAGATAAANTTPHTMSCKERVRREIERMGREQPVRGLRGHYDPANAVPPPTSAGRGLGRARANNGTPPLEVSIMRASIR